MGDVKLNDLLDQWCTPGLTTQAHRELLGCGSLEELRLKAALFGVDHESWLRKEGLLWRWPSQPPSCDWVLRPA